MRQRFPSVSSLEFRCCREIPSVNQKLTFDERIICITRHNGFSPRSHRQRQRVSSRSMSRPNRTENDWVYSHHYRWCISVIEIPRKLQLVGFSYNKKCTNVVMWKDKEYEYISSAWNKQQWEAHHSSPAKYQPKRMLNNRVRRGKKPLNQHFLAEFFGYLPLISLIVCVRNKRLRSRYGAKDRQQWRVKSPRSRRSERVHLAV